MPNWRSIPRRRNARSTCWRAKTPLKAMLFGGEPLDAPRHMWWNFVSSSQERIEQAKRDWEAGAFGLIPGDDVERIPLPAR